MIGFEGLLAGRLLCDRYRVEEVIGRGGMGAVYRATDVRLEREVAVKVMTAATADVAARTRLRARFHREARAAARLQHPNVVAVHDFGTDLQMDLDFLVMELLRGEDLASCLVHTRRLPLPLALEVLHQAACGVAAGHSAGLIHRDIKPGNLFLRRNGTGEGDIRVSVLDFGIVKLEAEEDDATMTHLTVFGRAPHSPAYAAPEQLLGEERITPACDVWALGITAFQILTGERPFSEADQRRLSAGIPVTSPSARSVNSAISAAVDEIIRTCLAFRTADRFRDAAALADALAGVCRSAALHTATVASRSGTAGSCPADDGSDHTLLDPAAEPPTSVSRRPEPAALSRAAAAVPPRRSFSNSSVPVAEPSAAKPGWVRRAASVMWGFTVTLASVALAGAFGVGLFTAFDDGLVEPFYASLVGLTFATPWAIHRMTRRRGSYLLALAGSAIVAMGALRFFAPLAGHEVAVVALAPAQVAVSFWIARLTRRNPKIEQPSVSPSLPG